MRPSFLHFLFCLFIFFSAQEASGQKKSRFFQIPGRVKVEKGDYSDTRVDVYNLNSNNLEKSINVTSQGKFDLELNYQNEYKISILKEGYYPKDILISTAVPENVWKKDSIFPPYSIVVTLFRKVPEVTLSFEGKAVGKISYSPNGNLDNFDSQNFISDSDIKDEIQKASKSTVEKKLNSLLASALELEKKNDLSGAYQVYLTAGKLQPDNSFIREKLKDLTADMKHQGEDLKLEAEFNRHILEGQTNVEKKNYSRAIEEFKSAVKIKPEDPGAKNKLAEAEQLLADSNAQRMNSEREFNRLLAQGDDLVLKKVYTDAVLNYNEALKIRPNDQTTLTKIAAVEKLIRQDEFEKDKIEKEFNNLVSSGDKNSTNQQYSKAIRDYQSALALKPESTPLKTKLAEAERLLSQITTAKAKMDEEFGRLVASGDDNVLKKLYAEGVNNYKEALKIKPGDAPTDSKLRVAEGLLAQMNADKAQLGKDFQKLIASGDQFVLNHQFPDGINDYKKALQKKPEDSGAKEKLSRAEELLRKSEEEKAGIAKEFARLVASGDENVSKKAYPDAVLNYREALKLKPGEQSVVTKLSTAEKLLAQSNDEKSRLEGDFKLLMASGDRNITAQKFPEGISDFKKALLLKPEDKLAKERLAIAEGLLGKYNNEKAAQDKEFTRVVTLADENVLKKRYSEAITGYQQALKIKKDDSSVPLKISTAEKLLAQENADKQKLEENFRQMLAEGDRKFGLKNYNGAISDFRGALAIKPENAEAKTKIAQAEQQLSRLAEDKKRLEADTRKMEADQKEKKAADNDKLYQDNIARGEENFSKSQWATARYYFIQALNSKSGDKYALTKVETCDKMNDARITAETIRAFQNLVTRGDSALKVKNYSSARYFYHSSLGLIPWEKIPQEKLREIDRLLSEALNQSDRQSFKENQVKADQAFEKKDYALSRFYYMKANEIQQDEHNLSRLKEIEGIVNGSEAKKIDSEYQDFVKKADEANQQKNFALARYYYQKAVLLKPDDVYSKDQLKKLAD